jgi:hypothetical protein
MSIKLILYLNILSLFTIVDTIYSITIKPAQERTKLGLTKTFDLKGIECQEIIIPNNFKKLVLKLESKNLDRVLITDQKIERCTEGKDIEKCCSRNSTFCFENVNPTQNEFRLNYCIDYTYVYACNVYDSRLRYLEGEFNNIMINNTNLLNTSQLNSSLLNNTRPDLILSNNTSTNVSLTNFTNNNSSQQTMSDSPPIFTYENKQGQLTLTTSVIKGQGCQSTESVPETECSSIGLNSCKDQNKCITECSYVECRKELLDPGSRVFAMCLPSKLSDNEVLNRCRNHIVFSSDENTSTTIEPKVYKLTCNRQEEFMYIPKESSHAFFKFILILFGVVILTTFITSVYYRFKMSMDGVPPFEAPAMVPNFIFPRQNNY